MADDIYRFHPFVSINDGLYVTVKHNTNFMYFTWCFTHKLHVSMWHRQQVYEIQRYPHVEDIWQVCTKYKGTPFFLSNVQIFIEYCVTSELRNYILTYLLTYSLHGVRLEKRTGSQLVQNFPTFYETRGFITASTCARHLSVSWTRSIQSISPHSISWRSILILSSNLRLGVPRGLLAARFPHLNPV